MKFSGISEDTLYLLSENRFNNSKAFYEEHKAQINKGAVHQMRAIVEDLMPVLININPDFILDPVRCVCRVRRDTRFTHDKSLYRANLWLMIRHQKNHLPTPAFWFEFNQFELNWGVGILSTTPAFMEFFRKEIVDKKDNIETACELLEKASLSFDGETYKKDKAVADGIEGKYLPLLYNARQVFFTHTEDSVKLLNQPEKLIDTLSDCFKQSSMFYNLMLDITTSFNSKGE
ncbi:MAG: DUF2461 family protein [Acutalibacteraceae bacterium]|nr:DUF2461 family protein [Acutalibacteraceae bacterium]